MMKKGFNNFSKKTIVNFLVMGVLVLGTVILSDATLEVQASSGDYYEQIEINNYQDGTVPKPQDAAHQEWLFAGWFEDAACTEAVENRANATGTKYAKFVSADVLSVKCQVTENTAADTETSKLRLVTTVDNLSYQKMGFEIKIGDNESFDHAIYKVWKKIQAAEGADEYGYEPNVFHTSSQYFATVTIAGIPKTDFSTGVRITPYWVTLDGTKVEGVSRYARVEDSYLNIVNVPVRMYSDVQAAAGYLEVSYDSEKFDYYPNADGSYDIGDVFETVEVGAIPAEGIIRCAGLVEGTSDKMTEGMYLNLRFRLKEGKQLADTETFTVFSEEFCKFDNTFVENTVSNVVYKTTPAPGIAETIKYGDSYVASFYELTSLELGDVNGDEALNIGDMVLLKNYLIDSEKANIVTNNSDLDSNDIIDSTDLTLLCKRLVGIE